MSTHSTAKKNFFRIELSYEDNNEDYIYKDYDKGNLDWHRQWKLNIGSSEFTIEFDRKWKRWVHWGRSSLFPLYNDQQI